MTSAPSARNTTPAYGAARLCPISITQTPSSGSCFVISILRLFPVTGLRCLRGDFNLLRLNQFAVKLIEANGCVPTDVAVGDVRQDQCALALQRLTKSTATCRLHNDAVIPIHDCLATFGGYNHVVPVSSLHPANERAAGESTEMAFRRRVPTLSRDRERGFVIFDAVHTAGSQAPTLPASATRIGYERPLFNQQR